MMMVYKAIPNTMPFLFPEMAEDMVEFQISALLDGMQRAKESESRVIEDARNESANLRRGTIDSNAQLMKKVDCLKSAAGFVRLFCPASACP